MSYTGKEPKFVTQPSYDNSEKVATTSYVQTALAENSNIVFSDAVNQTEYVASSDGSTFALWKGEPRDKLANFTLAGFPVSAVWSPNGKYIAAVHATTPFISVMRVDYATGVMTKLPNPATLPAAAPLDIIWSPDGKCMIVTLSAAPWVWTYTMDYDGETFTRAGVLPTMTGQTGGGRGSIKATSDNQSFVVRWGGKTAPYTMVTNHSINTTTGAIAYRDNAEFSASTSQVWSIGLNPVTNDLTVHSNNPTSGDIRFFSYDMTTKSFTYRFTDTVLPASSTMQVWNKNGTVLAITVTTSPGLICLRDLDASAFTFDYLTFSGTTSVSSRLGIGWHPDGSHFVCSSGGVALPQSFVYRVGYPLAYTVTSIGAMIPAVSSTDGRSVEYSPNGRLMLFTQFSLAAIQLYRVKGSPRIYNLLEGA